MPCAFKRSKMAYRLLSDSEKEYIQRGVAENVRADGRSNKDYRDFEIKIGSVSNTSGSAEIKLVQNRTRLHVIDTKYGHTSIIFLYIFTGSY